MNEEDFEIPEMDGDDMIVHIDQTTPEDVRDGLISIRAPCQVCGVVLGLPYVWIVPGDRFQGRDFFVHPHCVAALKSGKFFSPN